MFGLATSIMLVGCASSNTPLSTSPVESYQGEPKGVDAPPSSAGGAPFSVWLKDGDQFTVTLYGSSSCPPEPTSFTVGKKNDITLTLPKPAANKACTADYIPHTSVFATPAAIDRHTDVKITGQGMIFTLPALASS